MHKKVQSLVVAGIISAGAIGSTGQIFADNSIQTTKDIAIERANQNLDCTGGQGSYSDPYLIDVYNKDGLNDILAWLKDTSVNKSYYRYGEPTDMFGMTEYALHVFSTNMTTTYINIRVSTSDTDLLNLLNGIDKLSEDIFYQGGSGTTSNPHNLIVGTVKGLNSLLDSLKDSKYIGYYRSEKPVHEDARNTTYEICAVLTDGTEVHMFVEVENTKSDVINAIKDIDTVKSVLPSQPSAPQQPTTPPSNGNGSVDNSGTNTPITPNIEVGAGGTGSKLNPYALKVNTKEGLNKVLTWLGSNMSYDREEDTIVDTDANITTYKINVFYHDKTVGYVDIKVDSDNKELIDMLDKINIVLPPAEEAPEFKHEVVVLEKGDGNKDNPFELSVKDVAINEVKGFLTELKELNPKVEDVVKGEDYTLFKIKLDKKSRNTDNSVYVTIKVDNSQTEILAAFNDFAKETNVSTDEDKFEPVLDGTANDNMTVDPEVENNTSTNNSSNDNPKTGDTSIAGYATLGLASMLGIFKNRRKRK